MKILFLVNRDFVLYNFRIELVQRLLKENHEVFICLPDGDKVAEMVLMGCKFIPITIDKRGKSPFKDIPLIIKYHRIFKKIKPDVILLYTTKVCIYGGIVASKMKIPYIENISGLGTAVAGKGLLSSLIVKMYAIAVKNAKCVFFQNQQNFDFFYNHKVKMKKYRLISGSGVNPERWNAMEYPSDDNGIHFLFIARIINEKGIEEYLACAKSVKSKYPDTFFHVLGPCDGDYKERLYEYEKKGYIKYYGMVQDTREFFKFAHCTVHPSFYPEGISNVCLESAACCRPVITTDNTGCKETVDDGKTGFIVRMQDKQDLIKKVESFINMTNEERKKMGILGRKKVIKEFDRKIVVEKYMEEIEDGLQKDLEKSESEIETIRNSIIHS